MSDYVLETTRTDGPPILIEFDRLDDAVDLFNRGQWNPRNTRLMVRGMGYPIYWFAQNPCPDCNGQGTDLRDFGPCPDCNGKGYRETGYGDGDTIEVPCACSPNEDPEPEPPATMQQAA